MKSIVPTTFILPLLGLALMITADSAVAKPKDADKKKQPVTAKKMEPPAATPARPASPASGAAPTATPLGGMNLGSQSFDVSKEPTNISADSLTLLNDKRTFTYAGKVVVTQGDMTLMSDFLDGNYSDKNEIQKITARQNVEITKGLDLKAHGQRAEYDAQLRTIVLTETPSIEQNGSVLSADIIRIFIDENRSVADGNVKVTLKNTGEDLKSAAAGVK